MMVGLVTPSVEITANCLQTLWLKTVVDLEKRLMLMAIKECRADIKVSKDIEKVLEKPSPYLTGCMCDKLETIPVYGKEKRLGGDLFLLSAW